MITELKPIPRLLGIATGVDPSQVPLGGVIGAANMAELSLGRMRRIPGIESLLPKAVVSAISQIPLMFYARGIDDTVGIFYDGVNTKLVNMTDGAVMSGPALSGSFGQAWSHTYYLLTHVFAGGGNAPCKLDDATTYSALTGTGTPTGNLVCSYLDRLYVADIGTEEGIVRYSDNLSWNFGVNNIVNVKEIPGKVTALAINAFATDASGIQTELLIFKKNAMWRYDETSKDIISQVIGTESPSTITNTPVGTIFMGRNGNINSVFLLPLGSAGEPKDIGWPLYDLMNGANAPASPQLACAALHGKFLKLFFPSGNSTTCNNEVWLDLDAMKREEAIWTGGHTRGDVDAVCTTNIRLELARRGLINTYVWFAESSNTTSGFVDMDGAVLTAVLNIPLNVDPQLEEKIFDALELQIAPEANLSGNTVLCEPFAEEASKGSFTISLYNGKSRGISRVVIPMRQQGTTGMVARNARLKITHSLNTRLDILGLAIQYLRHEGRGDVKRQTT